MKKRIMGYAAGLILGVGVSCSAQNAYYKPLKEYQILTKEGVVQAEMGNYGKAIIMFNRAVAIAPQYAKAYNSRGIAWFDKGDSHRAIADFSKAIMYENEYADAYFNRGNVLAKLAYFKSAIADYDAALKYNPHLAEARYRRGVLLEQQHLAPVDIAYYQKILRIMPQHIKSYYKIVAIKVGKESDQLRFIDSYISRAETTKRSYYGRNTLPGLFYMIENNKVGN